MKYVLTITGDGPADVGAGCERAVAQLRAGGYGITTAVLEFNGMEQDLASPPLPHAPVEEIPHAPILPDDDEQ